MNLPWHLYLMAFLYIIAGINHFRNPGMYIRIIPPFFSNPKLINILSGAAEIILRRTSNGFVSQQVLLRGEL